MDVSRILAEIDSQISKLQQARALLAGTTAPATGAGRGRPKGSKKTAAAISATAPRKRKLSPEGRKRIADAMKKRWRNAANRTRKANISELDLKSAGAPNRGACAFSIVN